MGRYTTKMACRSGRGQSEASEISVILHVVAPDEPACALRAIEVTVRRKTIDDMTGHTLSM